jgi:hypothetical protein
MTPFLVLTFAMTLESPLYEMPNKKLSTVQEHLGRGEPQFRQRTCEAEKIIVCIEKMYWIQSR